MSRHLVTPLGVAIALALASPAFAQEAAEATNLDTVIVTGTRAVDRTVLESTSPVDVLTGFVNAGGDAHGRPVGVAVDKRGALLVADDVGNVIWRVSPR